MPRRIPLFLPLVIVALLTSLVGSPVGAVSSPAGSVAQATTASTALPPGHQSSGHRANPVDFVPGVNPAAIGTRPEAQVGFGGTAVIGTRPAFVPERTATSGALIRTVHAAPGASATPPVAPAPTVAPTALPAPSATAQPTRPAILNVAPDTITYSLSGSVTGKGNANLSGVAVAVFTAATSSLAGQTTSANDGTWSVDVAPGSYVISFSDSGDRLPDSSMEYVPGLYGLTGWQAAWADATVVTVASADIGSLDTQLAPYVTFSGTIKDPDGTVLYGIGVYVDDAYTTSAVDGTWHLHRVPGTYEVHFSGTGVTRGGWYANGSLVASQADASPIVTGWSDPAPIDLTEPFWPLIGGTVEGHDGNPLAGVAVAFTPTGQYQSVTTTTDVDGSWHVPANQDTIWHGTFTGTQEFAQGSIDVVVAGADVPGNDVVLHRYPVISGTVTDTSGNPLSGMTVGVSDSYTPSAKTAADGSYRIQLHQPATVTIGAGDGDQVYVDAWLGASGSTMDYSQAQHLVMAMDDHLVETIALPRYSHLAGTITHEDGSPAANMDLEIPMVAWGEFRAETAADGSYSIRVAPHDYILTIERHLQLPPVGYAGAGGFSYLSGAATPITVGESMRILNVTLPDERTIRGRVTSGGLSGSGVEVDLFLNGSAYASTATDVDGTWEIRAMPGAYTVGFYDQRHRYATGYFGSSGYTADPDLAEPVSIGTTDVAGINVSLPMTHRIAGTVVRSPNGTAVSGAYVEAWVNGIFTASGTTSSTGAFSLPVGAGKVRLWVTGPGLAPGWRTSSSLTANVASAAVTTMSTANVSGVTIHEPAGTVIKGAITVHPSAYQSGGVYDALIEAFAYGEAQGFGWTDVNGAYTMRVLPGTWGLFVPWAPDAPTQWPSAWYAGATATADPAGAAAVSVGSAQVVRNVDIPFAPTFYGALRNSNGFAVGNVDMVLVAGGSYYEDVLSDSYGSFHMPVLPGTYHLADSDPVGFYLDGWLGDASWVPLNGTPKDLVATPGATPSTTMVVPLGPPPAAPGGVTGIAYHEAAKVSWMPPTTSPDRPIIHGTVTASPGGQQCSAAGTSCVITGLSDGTPYTFTATASTMVGTSAASAPSAAVTPLAVPDPPSSVVATPNGMGLDVSWAVPGDNGHAIMGYVATASPGGAQCIPVPATTPSCTISFASEGHYAVSVTATSSLGDGLASSPAAAAVDVTPPVVGVPKFTLVWGMTMTGSAVPVSVDWAASDVMSGLVSTSLGLSKGGGPYVAQALPYPTAVELGRTLAASSSAYRFQAGAMDADGNAATPVTGPAGVIGLRQETGSGVVYHGTWSTSSTTAALGGHVKYTSTKGAYVTYTFTGRSITWISRHSMANGKALVYLDGKLVATVDNHSGPTTTRFVAWARNFSTSTKHVLKIVCAGTSGHARIDVDGFATIH